MVSRYQSRFVNTFPFLKDVLVAARLLSCPNPLAGDEDGDVCGACGSAQGSGLHCTRTLCHWISAAGYKDVHGAFGLLWQIWQGWDRFCGMQCG